MIAHPTGIAAADQQVQRQLADLPTLSIDELARCWQTLIGQPAPRRNKRALVKRLAYAIQATAWGGLAPATIAQMEAVYHRHATTQPASPPLPGSAYLREWHGVTYQVQVLPLGFIYAGRFYLSLSAIAREITGTRISGPVFFRLKGGAR